MFSSHIFPDKTETFMQISDTLVDFSAQPKLEMKRRSTCQNYKTNNTQSTGIPVKIPDTNKTSKVHNRTNIVF